MAAIDDFGHYTAKTLPGAYQLRPEGDATSVRRSPSNWPRRPKARRSRRRQPGHPLCLRAGLEVSPAAAGPSGTLKRIEGRPKAFGLWVYGDGSGNLLRLRFIDATHQTFQPQGDPMHWKGWRYVTFRWTTPRPAIGAAPMTAPPLPDPLGRHAAARQCEPPQDFGCIYVAVPTLIYDGGR